jgi:hypothetical protein
MTTLKPNIVAGLRFLSESEGGRKSATPIDFLGCIFQHEGENYECRLLLEEIGPVNPGDIVSVPIKFLRPELLKKRLRIGSKFQLREVQPIAEGIVEKILAME